MEGSSTPGRASVTTNRSDCPEGSTLLFLPLRRCVFRSRGRTNSGVKGAVSKRERATRRRGICSPVQYLRYDHRVTHLPDTPRFRTPRRHSRTALGISLAVAGLEAVA